MSDNQVLEPLHQISTAVSARDKKICENLAYSARCKQETERLKKEISLLQDAIVEKEKETKEMEACMAELEKSRDIRQETLRANEQSIRLHMTLKEYLMDLNKDLNKKYAATAQEYQDVLQSQREIYMRCCRGYQEVRELEMKVKKLGIQKMDLDVKNQILDRSHKQYVDIQWKRFCSTVVKFAEFYVLYHKDMKLRLELQERKKIEQKLIKEYLEQQAKQKEKKKSESSENNAGVCNPAPPAIAAKESADDKLRKLLSEDIFSCNLTSQGPTAQPLNKDNSKIMILDIKCVKPLPPLPPPKLPPFRKPDPNLRSKLENIVRMTRQNSLQGAQPKPKAPSQHKTNKLEPSESPRKKIMKLNQSADVKSASQEERNKVVPKSQSPVPQRLSQEGRKNVVQSSQSNLQQASTAIKQQSKEEAQQPSSILKCQKEPLAPKENTSKFFGLKKKSVTFQSGEKENFMRNFSIFGAKETETSERVTDLNLFRTPFTFSNEITLKQDENGSAKAKQSLVITPETGTTTEGSGVGTTSSEFNLKESSEELGFDLLETTFERSFATSPLQDPADFTQAEAPPTFNFFGSQKNDMFMF